MSIPFFLFFSLINPFKLSNMKFLTITALASLIATATATGHMDLTKRAYVTSLAIETVTVTEESYLFAYHGQDVANVVDNLQASLNGWLQSATDAEALQCQGGSCPLPNAIGEFLAKQIPKALPSMSTMIPANAKAVRINEVADQEVFKSQSSVPMKSADASRIMAEALAKLGPTQSISFAHNSDIASLVNDAFKDINSGINNGAIEFASVAGNIMNNAQDALNNLLADFLV
ncbi:hypothetical protein BY458DRAFT_517934 [Sporodiniella umbellata]|nr:hypothetical protein BY458DRAFT_517934 [Sporodiniella umbellata]